MLNSVLFEEIRLLKVSYSSCQLLCKFLDYLQLTEGSI